MSKTNTRKDTTTQSQHKNNIFGIQENKKSLNMIQHQWMNVSMRNSYANIKHIIFYLVIVNITSIKSCTEQTHYLLHIPRIFLKRWVSIQQDFLKRNFLPCNKQQAWSAIVQLGSTLTKFVNCLWKLQNHNLNPPSLQATPGYKSFVLLRTFCLLHWQKILLHSYLHKPYSIKCTA